MMISEGIDLLSYCTKCEHCNKKAFEHPCNLCIYDYSEDFIKKPTYFTPKE